ncbi:MAG: B12-binding domain-containing radical SAM protein [Candidatus Omnitrophica bacterium]|nr:B12-binding domain-containing radical SAM protein [Candidatus Omnitrophota bacterium]
MKRKILLVRTYQPAGIGGPLPPLELLYIASMIMKTFGDKYELKILDTGIGNLSLEEIKKELEDFVPQIICLNALIWEADLVHKVAALSKKLNKDIIILIQGQLASLAKEYLLQDKNIDCVVIGEGEITIVELLKNLEKNKDLSEVEGIVYRSEGRVASTNPRAYIENLDEITISSSTWNLIDIKEYAEYSNWNGSLKERFYIPILTSRGCPFDCTFCCVRNIYGKRYRVRSPENVLSEIKFLHEKYHVKEIHIFDAVFNYDVERAKKICLLIINSGMNLSLAFPYGVRADVMTEELITLLREAGTYKLVYGIETATPRLQKMIMKNLDLEQVKDIVRKTARTGIIVGGYFMLGFPSETYDEMMQTINFAASSDLDLAYFFKVTDYDDIVRLYQSTLESAEKKQEIPYGFEDLSYYSKKRSYAEISASELNNLILESQQKFYLNLGRIWRGLLKYPHKILFLKNLMAAFGLILQSYLIRKLTSSQSNRSQN